MNIAVHCLVIYILWIRLKHRSRNILKDFVHFVHFTSSIDVGCFSSFHEESEARLLMNSFVPRSKGALFLATSLLQ